MCARGDCDLEQGLLEVQLRCSLGKFGAACAKLSSWHEYTLRTRSWNVIDASDGSDKELYGWGFSMMYLRKAWEMRPFPHIFLGEDFDFCFNLRAALGLPVLFIYDARGVCAHTCHSSNTTGDNIESRSGGASAALYSPVATLVSMYETYAKSILATQEKNR